jgi:hypothetical protein
MLISDTCIDKVTTTLSDGPSRLQKVLFIGSAENPYENDYLNGDLFSK